MLCSICYTFFISLISIYQTQLNNNVKLDTDFETETEFHKNKQKFNSVSFLERRDEPTPVFVFIIAIGFN